MASLVKKLCVLFLVCHDLRQIGTNHCDSFQPKVEMSAFLNWSMVGLLKIGGKLTTLRAQLAHMVSHLPAALAYSLSYDL